MNMPSKVRIAGADYEVKFEERIIDDDGRALCGQISYRDFWIKIEPKVQGRQGQYRTLLHEIFHGIEHHFKMDFTEDEIDNLANGMCMVIMDNPEIFGPEKYENPPGISRR